MEILTVNLTGKPRTEFLKGRKYLVAPMSLIVPGVLNGSKGPLYYPPEEIGRNPDVWNNMPLVVYHPTKHGNPTSARDPDILNQSGIGFIFKARAKDKKLVAEGWFDIEDTERVDNRILSRLEAGDPIELSTGLFTDNEEAEDGATYNGTAYTHIARNYVPDHVAVLPDQVGACSIAGGCGVLVNQECKCENKTDCKCRKFVTHEELENWATKTLGSGTPQKVVNETVANEENSMADKKLIDGLIANCSCWKEEDRETLNSLTDEKLQELIDNNKKSQAIELVANAAQEGFKDTHVFNQESKKWELKEVKKEDPAPVANSKPKTVEEWFSGAPPEVMAVHNEALNITNQAKKDLVQQLIENVEGDDQRLVVANSMMEKSLDELRLIASLIPKKKTAVATPNYFGSQGAPIAPTANAAVDDDPLEPYVDWLNEND